MLWGIEPGHPAENTEATTVLTSTGLGLQAQEVASFFPVCTRAFYM